MLAGRIKDFLNRMVREHGSIDLEWLRDVPPDKAKEYLLSIRELGGVCAAFDTSRSCFPSGHKCWTYSCETRMGTPSATARVTSVASFRTVPGVGINSEISLATTLQA